MDSDIVDDVILLLVELARVHNTFIICPTLVECAHLFPA